MISSGLKCKSGGWGLEVFSVYPTAGSPHGLTRYVGTRLNTPVNQTRGYKYEKYRRRNTNSGSEGMSNRREAGGSSGISVHGVFIQLRWLPFMRTPNRGPAWMDASKQLSFNSRENTNTLYDMYQVEETQQMRLM